MNTVKRLASLALCFCLLACALPALGETVYRQGDAGPEILAIKERMRELGYYTGAITHNRFNDTMTERVKQLQKANGLPQTGTVDEALCALIFSDSVVMKNGLPASALYTPGPRGERVLFCEGMCGGEITRLKQRLRALGYYEGAILTNAYNRALTARVERLQKVNGLPQTGAVNEALYDLIFSEAVLAADGEPLRGLAVGDAGWQVAALRVRLAELGYLEEAAPSDLFDEALAACVRILWRQLGLEETGEVPAALYCALFEEGLSGAEN